MIFKVVYMGFLDNNDSASSGSSDKLDLVEFESNLIKKFNDTDVLTTKYMAEEFGITFDKRKKNQMYTYMTEAKRLLFVQNR